MTSALSRRCDSTPLWGQTAHFRCGTHDGEPRALTILPDKPVKSLTLHCLFRGHADKVWFDDLSDQRNHFSLQAIIL